MISFINLKTLSTLMGRTFRQSIESPIFYVVAIFFYGFVGILFGLNYFIGNQVSIDGVGQVAPWVLWFVIPALTMGLISEETRNGTYEQLATLPVQDWEIVLGKFLGFSALAFVLILGLLFYPILITFTAQPGLGLEWGPTFGVLAGLYMLCLFFGAIGLFSSSLAKSQVVCFILGVLLCTFFFFMGQFNSFMPNFIAGFVDAAGVMSHLTTLSRGVWDLRDIIYFFSGIFLFLYFATQRLTTRRF